MGADHNTASLTTLADLASARVGGRAVATNDEFFAPKEHLIKAQLPQVTEIPKHEYDSSGWNIND